MGFWCGLLGGRLGFGECADFGVSGEGSSVRSFSVFPWAWRSILWGGWISCTCTVSQYSVA